MKTIFRIAKAELRMLFCSPIAWLILIVFTIICSLDFFDKLLGPAESATAQGLGLLTNLTMRIFTSEYLNGLFFIVQRHLYMFVPLLTMGLISQELNSGTIKLLRSSPVSNHQIVLGKFTTMMVYGLFMMGVIFLFALLTAMHMKDFDWPTIFSGLLGLYLLFLTYAAIGIFMSSLTNYQVVAAISTFAAFVVLNMIGNIRYAPEWTRGVSEWMSIVGRAEEMLAGMISSQDVLYFLILSTVFLSLTVLRLYNKGRNRPAGTRWGGYAAVVAAGCAVGMLSSMPQLIFFKDTTRTKRLTITPSSQEIIKQVKGKVMITNYVNLVGRNYNTGFYPSRNYEKRDVWMPYLRYKPDMKLKYVFYWHESDDEEIVERFPGLTWEQRAARIAEIRKVRGKVLGPEEIDERIDLSDEGYRLISHVQFADGREMFLRKFTPDPGIQPHEREISAAFKRMISGPAKVGFLCGHGERSIDSKADAGYWKFAGDKWFRSSLLNQGFDAIKVSLAGGSRIPDDIRILVISDLREPLAPEEEAEILRYVQSGRNLLITTKPGRQCLINPFAEKLGIRFMDGRVVNPVSENLAQNVVMSRYTQSLLELSPAILKYVSTRPKSRVAMPGPVGIEYAGKGELLFQNETYLVSDSLGWVEYQTSDFADHTAELNPETGEKAGRVPVAMGLSRRLPRTDVVQRVLVLGDAGCFSNVETGTSRLGYINMSLLFLSEMFRWLSNNEYPVDVSRPDPIDRGLYMDLDGERMWRWVFVGGIPLLMLIGAVTIIVRRKSK